MYETYKQYTKTTKITRIQKSQKKTENKDTKKFVYVLGHRFVDMYRTKNLLILVKCELVDMCRIKNPIVSRGNRWPKASFWGGGPKKEFCIIHWIVTKLVTVVSNDKGNIPTGFHGIWCT